MTEESIPINISGLESSLLFSSWKSQRRKVKFRILYRNTEDRIPGYGVTIPRHISKNFLHISHFYVNQSGNAIVLVPVKNR